nr:hypothetical protein [uncultured Brevundimonas sp.]
MRRHAAAGDQRRPIGLERHAFYAASLERGRHGLRQGRIGRTQPEPVGWRQAYGQGGGRVGAGARQVDDSFGRNEVVRFRQALAMTEAQRREGDARRQQGADKQEQEKAGRLVSRAARPQARHVTVPDSI